MAKHEFGIMQTAPQKGKRYDEYAPRKYNCITVDDDYLEDIIRDIREGRAHFSDHELIED